MKGYDVCVVFASLLVIGVMSPILGCAWLREWQENNWNPRGDDYTNAPPVATDDIFAACVIHGAPESVRAWPIVSQATAKWRGGDLQVDLDDWSKWPAPDGTIGNIWCFLYRDGKWHGGPCDGFRPPNRNFRSKSCFCCPGTGDQRLYEPQSGETVKVMISGPCRKGHGMKPAQRSTIVEVVWP